MFYLRYENIYQILQTDITSANSFAASWDTINYYMYENIHNIKTVQ